MIYIHALSGEKLLMDKERERVCTLYVLDENNKKILYRNAFGVQEINVDNTPTYHKRICQKKNLIPILQTKQLELF